MSNRFMTLVFSSVFGTLSSTPAIAAPNAFWTFGFDRHYAIGTGGRAQLPPKIMLAAARSDDPDVAEQNLTPILSIRTDYGLPYRSHKVEASCPDLR